MNARFTVTLTCYHWHCGDGCCSDSGYKLEVRDNCPNGLTSLVRYNDNWEDNGYYSTDYLLLEATDAMTARLGRKPVEGVDYEVVKDDEWMPDYDDDDDNY